MLHVEPFQDQFSLERDGDFFGVLRAPVYESAFSAAYKAASVLCK